MTPLKEIHKIQEKYKTNTFNYKILKNTIEEIITRAWIKYMGIPCTRGQKKRRRKFVQNEIKVQVELALLMKTEKDQKLTEC